jgi:hypothetical protein
MPEILTLIISLLQRVAFRFERKGEENLDKPGAEFAGCGGDAVRGAAIAGWEDFCRDLWCLLATKQEKKRARKGRAGLR